MKHLNFFSKRQTCSHNVVTLASTVGSPSVHRRSIMLRLLSILVLVLTFGVGTVWGADVTYTFSSASGNPGSGNDWYSGTIDSYTTWTATNGSTASNHPKYYSTGTGLRVYSGGKFKIESSKTISSIKFTFSSNSYTFLSSSSTNPLTETPDATSWEVSVTRAHCRLQAIEITYASATAHTVRFYKTSSTYEDKEEAEATAGVTPPAMTLTCGDWEFQGWSEGESDDSESTDELELVTLTNGKYYPDADITLYPVYTKTVGGGTTWAKMLNNPEAGDVVLLVSDGSSVEGKDKTESKYITTQSYTSVPAGLLPFTVEAGYSSGTLSFKNGSDYLQYNGSNNELNLSTTKDNKSSWTVSVNGTSGVATITNKQSTSRVIKYNTGSPRFACYTSGQQVIQLYKQTSLSTIYYYSYPSCCTELGSINGSIKLISGTSATLKWDNLSGVHGTTPYTVTVSPNAGTTVGGISTVDGYKNCTVTGLTAGTAYTFTINAFGDASHCDASQEVAATTPKITLGSASGASSYIEGSGPGSKQTFTVTAVGLTGNLTVNAPANFAVCATENGSYTSSINLTPNNGAVSTTVYFQLVAEKTAASSPYAGNITVSGGSATEQTVAVNGTVSPSCAAPTINNHPTGGVSYNMDVTATALTVSATKNGTGPALTYQWYSNTEDDNTSGTKIDGAESYEYTPSTDTKGTTYYYCVVSSGLCSAPSNTAAITVNTPSITASETARDFSDRKVNDGPYEMTFTVSGADLAKDQGIGLAITGTNADMFSIKDNVTSISQTSAGAVSSTTITVQYTPTSAGSHVATLTLSSKGADNKTVALSGTGKWEVVWMRNGGEYAKSLVADNTKPIFPAANPTSCDATSTTFIGWATSAWDGKLDDVNDKTIHTDNSTMSNITANGTTFHAVFAKTSGGGSGITYTLTANSTTWSSYAQKTQDDDQGLTWSMYSSKGQSGGTYYWGLNKNANGYNIESPTFPNNVSSISVNITNASARDIYICSSDDNDQPTSGDLGSASVTTHSSFTDESITLSGTSFTKFYIYVSGGVNFHSITVTTSSSSQSEYLTNCCTDLDAINGAVKENSKTATGLTLQWDDITNVTGWTVSGKDDENNDVAAANIGEPTDAGEKYECAISNLTAGKTYTFTIIPTHAPAYCSDYSNNTVTVTMPKITLSESTLTGMIYIEGAGPSAQEKSFTVTGVGLTGNLAVSAPANFQISTDNTNWGTEETITTTAGSASGTVYVRLAKGLAVGSYGSTPVYVTVSGGNASAQTVAVQGSVSPSCHTPGITGQPEGASYKLNMDATALSVTASKGDANDPTLTYQWKQCATIDGTYDYVASNGNASTYMPSTGAVGTTYYKCEVISGACSILSEAAAVTVLEPTITVSDNAVGFGDKAKGSSNKLTFTVSGANLAKDEGITLTLNDETGMFSIDQTSLDATDNAVGTTTITITYAPTAVGTHNASITISSEGATSQTVNLSGTAKWTVTWNVAGTPTSNLAANGAKPTLPSAPADNALSDCSNKFMGWSAKNANDAYKTEAYYDDLFADTEHAPTISDNAEFFAVFATQTGSNAASTTFSDALSDGSEDISSNWSDDYISSSSGMSYNTGEKVYVGEYGMKIGSGKASGYITCTLTSVISTKTIKVNAKKYSDDTGSISITVNDDTEFGSPQSPSTDGGELTFTVDDAIEVTSVTVETSSKRAYIKSITVGEAATTSDYITICPAVEAPTIILATGEYCGEQSTMITAADGTTIKYTTDGTAPSKTVGTEYTGAITIDQSMTLKAVAIKDENVSAVTEATYTLTFPKTVSFDAGTGTCVASMTEESCGDGIVLPSATPSSYCAAEGWTFAGWATANNTTTAPTLKVGDPYDCTETTLYAVYVQGDEYYHLVTELPTGEDIPGKYVMVYTDGKVALEAATVSGKAYQLYGASISAITDGVIDPENIDASYRAKSIWDVTYELNHWIFKNDNTSKYLYGYISGNYHNISIQSDKPTGFDVSLSNGYAVISSADVEDVNVYYSTNDSKFEGTDGDTKNIHLYKKSTATYSSNPVCCDIEAVTNLNAAVKSATSVTLSWTAPASIANITEYKVLDANDNVLVYDIDKNETSVDVTGLTECQTYTLRVVSYSDVCSVESSSVETTPSASTKTVTFDYNGGTGSVSSVSTVCGVATVALPTPDEREGYNFKGWNDGTTTYAPSTETYTPEANITLTAQWAQLFTVSYNLAGATNIDAISSATYEAGETVELTDKVPNKGIMASFKEWSFSPNVTMTDATHFTMPSSNVTITATYNGVGEGSWILVEDASEVTVGSFIIIAAAGSNVAMGAQNTSNRGQQAITKSGNVLTYETAPAIFEVKAGNKGNTVAFYDGNGYIYAASSSSNDLKTKNTLDDNGSWTVTINGSAEATVTAQGSNTHNLLKKNTNSALFSCYTSGQSAIALYKFYENVPTVTYHANTDAEVTGMPNPSRSTWSDLNDRYEVTIAAGPSRYHYEFAGWYDNESGTGEAYSGTITIADDINLYAKWTAATPHHVTYNTSGSSGTTPTDATDYYTDDEVTLASGSGLTNSGYFFDGWRVTYVDGESAVRTLTVEEGKFIMPNFDVTATATWAPKSDDKWTLVSSTGMLEVDGEYAIVCANADNDKYYAMSKTQNTNNRGVAEVEFDGDNLVGSSSMAIFTLKAGEAEGQWAFYDPANTGYIYAASSGSNHLKTQEENDANGSWIIEIENSIATITAQGGNSHNILMYNNGSDIFSCYTGGQKAVKLYKKKAVVRIENAESMNTSAISAGADVIVEAGGTLTVNADKEINDLTVKAGGEVVLNSNALTVVGTFTIKTEMASGNSGQLTGATSTNFAANGPAYIDITLGDNGNPNHWHAFTVPFPVDAINGVFDLDGNKLTNEVNYAIMDYHGDIRATGAYGWKKFRGIMTPGTFYLMTVDGLRTTYRFMKTANGAIVAGNTKALYEYASTTENNDNGWNGVGNPTLMYGQVAYKAQVLNPVSYTYEAFNENETNFIVGTPFFIQATEDGTMTFAAASGSANYAPARQAAKEIKDVKVTFGNEEYTDKLYISASEDALNQYETGKDLVKMTMTNTPSVAQIFGKAYNTKLCMVYAPLSNDQAVYDLTLYAPQAGEYTIAAPSMDNADLYLTYEGSIIWNLSMSEYVADFAKGNNEGYGLLLVRKAPNAATGVDEVTGDKVQCTKVVIDDHVYILRGEQLYGIDGKMVK